MVSIPEGSTNNIPMAPNPYVSTKNASARKSLCQFTKTLDVKHKTSICGFFVAKAKRKTIKKSMCCGQTLQSAVIIKKN